jgi:hypothetical protein
MKNTLLLAVTLALATASIVNADVGDTVVSSEAKYGKGTFFAPYITYTHNGWWIRQTFNDKEICVMAEFARLDGKMVTDKQAHNMDKHNLPAITIDTQNGWTTTKWKDDSNLKGIYSFEWSTSDTHCQVLAGQFRYGNDTNWFYGRTYITPAGLAIVKQENAKNDASQGVSQDAGTNTADPDTNI